MSAAGDALRASIERYNDAWNAHDLDAIVALHTPDMVFENGLVKRKDVYSTSHRPRIR